MIFESFLFMFKDLEKFVPNCCVSCGEFVTPKKLVCDFCFSKLSVNVKERESFGHKHLYLYDWKESSFLHTKLVMAQKKRISETRLSQMLIPLFIDLETQKEIRESLVVPCPPKKEGSKDHAYRLAKMVSNITGAKLESCLNYRGRGGNQKAKAKEERREIKFNAKYLISRKKIVFIDDVLTTGSTFKAALDCLGEENEVSCFSLFFRNLYNQSY